MFVILGASCSGKDTLFRGLKSFQKDKGFNCKKEYTTRPKRAFLSADIEDSYHYVKSENYLKALEDGAFVSNFRVETNNGPWYYGISRLDTLTNDVILTNPTSFYQLKEKFSDICSIYLEVSQRERLIRMLKRGDNIHESYRRTVHDEGHFSGISQNVDYVIDAEHTKREDILHEVLEIINFTLNHEKEGSVT